MQRLDLMEKIREIRNEILDRYPSHTNQPYEIKVALDALHQTHTALYENSCKERNK